MPWLVCILRSEKDGNRDFGWAKDLQFFLPEARITVQIGGAVWGWHVENWKLATTSGSPAYEFRTHFDRGDPNWDVWGQIEHVIEDGLLGFFDHHHDNGLDPKC
jgi:hypothetical protein